MDKMYSAFGIITMIPSSQESTKRILNIVENSTGQRYLHNPIMDSPISVDSNDIDKIPDKYRNRLNLYFEHLKVDMDELYQLLNIQYNMFYFTDRAIIRETSHVGLYKSQVIDLKTYPIDQFTDEFIYILVSSMVDENGLSLVKPNILVYNQYKQFRQNINARRRNTVDKNYILKSYKIHVKYGTFTDKDFDLSSIDHTDWCKVYNQIAIGVPYEETIYGLKTIYDYTRTPAQVRSIKHFADPKYFNHLMDCYRYQIEHPMFWTEDEYYDPDVLNDIEECKYNDQHE